MSTRKAILSANARSRLKEIGRYTQQQFGRAQRVKYIESLSQAIDELRHHPTLGRSVPGLKPTYRRYRVGRHFIYFQFDESVLSLLHISMVPSLHLEPES